MDVGREEHGKDFQEDDDRALGVTVGLLIGGLFRFPLWAGGFCYRDHPSKHVRNLATLDSCLFVFCCALLLCMCVLVTTLVLVFIICLVVIVLLPPVGFNFNS